MSGWERLRGNANALFSDLSTGNLVDQGGNHGWADILFFVFAPYVIIPLLLPLDVFISKAGHEWLHGRWEDSHTHSKLTQATLTLALQIGLALHRYQIANNATTTFYIASGMPTLITLMSTFWYLKNRWPPSSIRSYLCGVVVADLVRAMGYNSLITESADIRCYSLLAVLFGSRHLVWPWNIGVSAFIWFRDFVSWLCSCIYIDEGILSWLNDFIHFGLQSFSRQSKLAVLNPKLVPAELSREFQATWEQQDKTEPDALLEAVKVALFRPAMDTIAPRLFYHASQLYLVVLISQVADRIPRIGVLGWCQAFVLVLKTLFACVAMMTFDAWRVRSNGMFDLKLKGLLSCQVLQKCLRLPANTARSGEPRSILSAEMIQLIETMSAIHRLWLAPVELAMNLVVLCSYSILLTFCLLPVLIVITLTGISPMATLFKPGTEDMPTDGIRGAGIFTSIGLIGMIADPFLFLLQEGSAIQLLHRNLRKISQFLCQEEHHDDRIIMPRFPGAAPEHSHPVTFRSASIAPSRGMPAVLSNMDIAINAGSLTVVSGTVASGVSLFLKAIVGEAAIVSGQLKIRGAQSSIGYCPQDPWFFETSFFKVITGGMRYKLGLYREVIVACMLAHDIDHLEGLDKAAIGPGGSWLSIGLWQRLAVARAAYAETKTVVIDNLFSTQSEQMACALFQRLLGPSGFFTKRKITVILASDSVRHFQLAQKVIFIDENHNVEQASGATEIQTMVTRKLQHGTIVRDADQCEVQCNKPNEGFVHIASLRAEPYREPQPPNEGNTDMVGYTGLWNLAPKSVLVEWGFLIILQAAFARAPEALLQRCIETSFASHYWLWLYTLAMCGRGILAAVEGYMYVPAETENIHQDLIHAIIRKPFDTLSTVDVAWAFNQIFRTSNISGNGWKVAVRASIHSSLLVLCDFILIATSVPILLLVLPLAILSVYWIQLFCVRVVRQLRTLKHVANSKLLSILDVTCQQLQNVRGEGTSDRQLRFLLDLLEQEQQVDQAKLQIVAWRRMCQRGVSGILVIATTSVALFVTPTYSTVTIGFVLFLSNWMWLGIDNMFNSIADLDHYANSASRLGEFINDVAPRVADSKAALTRQYRGAIEFKEVSIDRSTPAQTRTVLRHVSCKINAGENIGVVGRTASGRTTLFLTLLQQLPYKGSIKIDGIELSTIPRHKLNCIFTSISQRPINLPGTVRDNIFPWDMAEELRPLRSRYTDEQIYQLLDDLNLRDYILTHGGLDADVKDMHYSSGQRQLMAIATACFHHFSHNTKIVLIDESTELLDARLDNQAHRVIANVFKTCTKLFFAHRRDILAALDANADLGDIGEDFRYRRNMFKPPAYATAAEYAEARDHQSSDDEDIYDP